MRNKLTNQTFGIALIILGCLCVLTAAGLTIYNIIEDYNAGKKAGELLIQVEEQVPDADEKGDEPSTSSDVYAGIIEIPAIDIKLPVFASYSLKLLKEAPCIYRGENINSTESPTQMVICGHNYKSHLGKLKELSVGTIVKFTNMKGILYQYQVIEMLIIDADDYEVLMNGNWDLSMFTCTADGKQRVLVRCSRTS